MIHVAILGFGTVGSGVAEVMSLNAQQIAHSAAEEIRVKYILDIRDFPDSPYKDLFVKDFSVIEQDPEVRVVVETIGGTSIAYEYTKRALLAGKSVVTSNKALVAKHGYELLSLAKAQNLNYLFEASVGGGVPIIRPLSQCLAANRIDEICGILNGTTNYILTQMIQKGDSFEAALKQAQEKGYAERDPSDDINGADACRKICILAALAFGRHVYPEQVPTQGITQVSNADVENAARAGYRIKLLGRALRTAEGKVSAYVAPQLVGEDSLLSDVDGVFNGILVRGNAIGDVIFYGQGAGKLPTASAVVADVIDAAKHLQARKYVDWEEGGPAYFSDPAEIESRWYVRCGLDQAQVEKAVGPAEKLAEGAYLLGKLSGVELDKKLGPVQAAYRVID